MQSSCDATKQNATDIAETMRDVHAPKVRAATSGHGSPDCSLGIHPPKVLRTHFSIPVCPVKNSMSCWITLKRNIHYALWWGMLMWNGLVCKQMCQLSLSVINERSWKSNQHSSSARHMARGMTPSAIFMCEHMPWAHLLHLKACLHDFDTCH